MNPNVATAVDCFNGASKTFNLPPCSLKLCCFRDVLGCCARLAVKLVLRFAPTHETFGCGVPAQCRNRSEAPAAGPALPARVAVNPF